MAYDLPIENGTVIEGTGAPRRHATVDGTVADAEGHPTGATSGQVPRS